MTNAPNKKRSWFQLHLSTCVMLMVLAGTILWANHRVRLIGKTETCFNFSSSLGKRRWWTTQIDITTGFGWPLVFQTLEAEPDRAQKYAWVYPKPELYRPEKEPPPVAALFDMPDDEVDKYFKPPYVNTTPAIQWNWTRLALNGAATLALLLLAAFACEWILRRQRPVPPAGPGVYAAAGRLLPRMHARTFVVVATVFAMLIFANILSTPTAPRSWLKPDGSPIKLSKGDGFWETDESIGWPEVLLNKRIDVSMTQEPEPEGAFSAVWRREWIGAGVAINAATSLALLTATALACEFFIRRRERARAAAVPGPDTAHPE